VRLEIKMFEKTAPGSKASRDDLGLSYDRPDEGRFVRR